MIIEEAKQLYVKYNCSLQAMFREAHDKYISYKELKIDGEMEQKWKKECIHQKITILERTGDVKCFNQLYELTVSINDKEHLDFLVSKLKSIRFCSPKEVLCIVETILGRKKIAARDGMIFWALKLGEYGIAFDLIKIAEKLLACEEISKCQERKERLFNKLQEIKKVLCDEMQDKRHEI